MIFNNFNLCLENVIDCVVVMLVGLVVVGWFLRYDIIELRDGPKFGIGGGVDTKVEIGEVWRRSVDTKAPNITIMVWRKTESRYLDIAT